MKTALFSAVGAFALAAVAFSGGAQAQCVWTGYAWSCGAQPPAYAQPYSGAYQYPGDQYAPGYGNPYGYQPGWSTQYPGPRVSGH
ncbi:MAG TPA: hypothetical protein VKQ73_00595 [Stellaceae bacterium]|nr:hypothetical protein [Stellaceae bacterium]